MHHRFLCHLFLIEITWPIDQTATDRPWYRARNKPCDVWRRGKRREGEREREKKENTGNRDHRSSRYRSHGWRGRNSESNGRAAGTKREPRTMRRKKRAVFRVERGGIDTLPLSGNRRGLPGPDFSLYSNFDTPSPPGYSILDSAFKIKNKKKITPSILPFMLEQLITNWTFYRVYNHPRLSQNPARFISPLSAIQNCSWKRVNRSRPGYIRQIARGVAGCNVNSKSIAVTNPRRSKKGNGGRKTKKERKTKSRLLALRERINNHHPCMCVEWNLRWRCGRN